MAIQDEEEAPRPTLQEVIAAARETVDAMTLDEITSARNTGLLDPRIRARELHVADRSVLLRITGAEVRDGRVTGIPVMAGLPVYYDEAMPNGVMEMRDSSTGETLRRWILGADGTLMSINVQALERFVVQPFKF
jgi:hypothetical protein